MSTKSVLKRCHFSEIYFWILTKNALGDLIFEGDNKILRCIAQIIGMLGLNLLFS